MKKSLVALAAMAVVGGASAQFSIDGLVDAGVQGINWKGNSITGVYNNGMATSVLNFRGKENLGGGNQVEFRMATDWNPVSNYANTGKAQAAAVSYVPGNGWLTDEVWVAARNDAGEIKFGAVNNNNLVTYSAIGQPFGTAVGSFYRAGFASDAAQAMNAALPRFDNSLQYTSPTVSGFKAAVLVVKKVGNAATGNFTHNPGQYDRNGITDVGLYYNNGPLNAGYASMKEDNIGVATTTVTAISQAGALTYANTDGTLTFRTNTLGANYALGDLTLYVLNQRRSNSGVTTSAGNVANTSATTISAKYQMGANAFLIQTGSVTNKNELNAATVQYTGGPAVTAKSAMLGLGYQYDLSKTTKAYLHYEKLDDTAGIIPAYSATTQFATTSSATRTRTAAGIKMNF